MAPTATYTTATLKVPGANLYYEVRGTGPVLLFMPGGPADATTFRKIENLLAPDHTVVTYDPRNHSRSTLDEPTPDERMVEIYADDVHRLVQATSPGARCSIFASSGGASISLELIRRHADELDRVIVHEPPTPSLLPNTAEVRAGMEDVCDTYAAQGLWPAAQKFMNLVGIHEAPPPPQGEPTPEQQEAMAMMQKNMDYFFGRYIRNVGRYEPDLQALKAAPCRIIPACGSESKGQLAHGGARGLATALGAECTVFPGDHGGWDKDPDAFAVRLREVLAGRT